REALGAKNSLTAGHAKVVEDAFEQRLSQLGSSSEAAMSSDDDGSKPEAAVVGSRSRQSPSLRTNLWRKASTQARSRLQRHGATATATTCAMSPSSRA